MCVPAPLPAPACPHIGTHRNASAMPPHLRAPGEPLVEVGGSIHLHCSLDCPEGEVQWEGLDTDQGNIVSNHTSSTLTVTNATVRMGGTKICTGQCQGKSFQKTVELQVYSFPDTLQLDSQPTAPTARQPAQFFCVMSHVFPPDTFTLSWFQGDDRVQSLVEEDTEESELCTFSSQLETPMAAEHTTYRCEAELQIGQRLLRRSRTVTVRAQETASSRTAVTASDLGTLQPHLAATDGNSLEATTGSPPPFRSTKRPTISRPVGTTTAAPTVESLTNPTAGTNPTTGSLSTAWIPSGRTSTLSSKPLAGVPSTSGKVSAGLANASLKTLANLGVTSKTLPATDGPLATELVSTTKGLLTKSTAAANGHPSPTPEDPCRPVITHFPPQGTVGGTLRITCHAAECHKDIQVWWVETPVAQSQYHQEKTEGRSSLMVDSIGLEHQGVYQCVTMTSQPRMASTHVVIVSAAPLSTNAVVTIGAAGSVLGLFVASYVFRRLWQHRSS
ncbi:mucosal addressin cell adhesion molecule 1 [Sphaerodactylus townsendi]|uniref:mucosal addressin cell adhesion molecule 1 n=1 Tax=Sphaerodactylus townsendi TaxID=933632 RepID=UPI0020275C7E|nr:mucosal addressin cell adhesion molecule 1 [Sphaerodactylus townsendi]